MRVSFTYEQRKLFCGADWQEGEHEDEVWVDTFSPFKNPIYLT